MWPEVVWINTRGIELLVGRERTSSQWIANARVVINCDGLVIKDGSDTFPRPATMQELQQARVI